MKPTREEIEQAMAQAARASTAWMRLPPSHPLEDDDLADAWLHDVYALALAALDQADDAALGGAVRDAIALADPEGLADRLAFIAGGFDDDEWVHIIVTAIAEALRAEVAREG